MSRLGIVHRWGGSPEADWYPWLLRELRAARPRPFEEVEALSMPDPDRPDPATWVPEVAAWLGEDRARLARTALVGHSVGCQAIVRALTTLRGGAAVAGALLVAPWFWLDEDERDATSALWEESAFDERAARRAAGRVVALLSDDDPFTSDWRTNAGALEKRLGAEVVVERGARHFNAVEEPRVLELVRERLAPAVRPG
ncbi:MAG TPA: alpha/beta hydrolase [Gaiellaceae bacterium]|nr:alpha/beta hydrolase [Gaiellaceae bacterium]